MGLTSVWHWIPLLIIAMLLFGGSGKISSIMGDVAKGIKSFKKGLADDDDEIAAKARKTIEADAARATDKSNVG